MLNIHSKLKYLLLILVTCFFFYNGWIEDVLDQGRDFITLQKPINDQDIIDRLNEPFKSIREKYPFLNEDYEKLNQITPATNELIEFKEKIITAQNELTMAFSQVTKTADELKDEVKPDKDKLLFIMNEQIKIEQENTLYAQWFAATLQNLDNLLSQTSTTNAEAQSEQGSEQQVQETDQTAQAEQTPKTPPRQLQKVDIRALIKKNLPQDKNESGKLLDLANQELQNGNYEGALENYQKSIELDKNNYKAMEGFALVFFISIEFIEYIYTVNIAIDVFKEKNIK